MIEIPPQAVDLEEAVIGACLSDSSAIVRVSDKLTPEHFYKQEHKVIYESILNLYKAGEGIDILTVCQDLRKRGKMEFVGGEYLVANLSMKVASTAHLEQHALIVVELSVKRGIINAANEVKSKAYSDQVGVFDLMDEFSDKFRNLASLVIGSHDRTAPEIVKETLKQIDQKAKKEVTGVQSRITRLNDILGGYNNSDLIIVAARPGMGKTAFMSTEIIHACRLGKAVRVASTEMSANQLMIRILAQVADVDSEVIRKGELNEGDYIKLNKAVALIERWNLVIDDNEMDLNKITLSARSDHNKRKFDIMFIDYLQRVTNKKQGRTRNDEVAEIAKEFKTLAKQLNVPVVSLAQLNRGIDDRANKRPLLSDLRESGDIEQEADIVMFLYRPEYYKKDVWEDGSNCANEADIMIEKHRHGSLGIARCEWNGSRQEFRDKRNMIDVPF